MRAIAVLVLTIGLLGDALASRGGGHHSGGHSSGGHSSRSHSGMSGTGSSSSSHGVRGYTRKNGTYVAPHRQTNADHTQLNNYSTRGNVNPSTGRVGTRGASY